MKKISCIIPVYNVENYIEKCVSSIVEQYTDEIEIIIVNDGTKDQSIEKIKNYKNIQIINKENGGLSSARNIGMKCATGKYIWFIDGDDYIEKGAISKLLKEIELNNDIILFNYYKENEHKKKEIIENNNNYKNERKMFINTSACTKIFKKSFLEDNNIYFHEGILYEDLALIPYVMLLTNKIGYLDDCLYTYVSRNNSIMKSRKFNKKKDDKFVSLNDLKEKLIKKELYDLNKEQYIYITIRHLLIVYSTEIIEFGRKIYKERFDKVNMILNDLDNKWIDNKYLKEQSSFKKMFVYLFKNKMYFLCKIIIFIMKGTGKI